MDEVAKKVAVLGRSGVILVITVAATGLTGAAAMTTALETWGVPAVIMGGIAILAIIGLIADALAKVGIDGLLTEVYRQRRQSELRDTRFIKINGLPLFDDVKNPLSVAETQNGNQQSNFAISISKLTEEVIEILENVPGMTFATERNFKKSRPIFTLRDRTVVRSWKNILGFDYIFLSNSEGKIIYGGFVGWFHSAGLKEAINHIRREFT